MVKKIEKPEPINFGYSIEIESFTEETREPNPNDPWDRGNTSTHNSFRHVSKTEIYPDIASSLDIPVGAECHVVWVVWSTGDTFGRDEGRRTSLIGVFQKEGAALGLQREIERRNQERHNIKDYNYSFEFVTSDGQELTVYQSWFGYFDSLDAVHVEQTVMQ
jgi:hypothetical protein